MLRNVGLVSVAVGVAVTTLLALLLETIVLPPINLFMYDLFAVERAGGAVSFTGDAWNAYMVLSTSLMLGALPVSFLLGGVSAGVVARSRPAINGLTSAAVVVALGFAWLLATALPSLMDPISNPGEVYTRSENLQMLFLWGTAFCAVTPFALLAGYLGGRFGGRRGERAHLNTNP
ncbi:hypothetical protein GBA63_07620 [Rubrobacter tropicus]|uniref:Uncharacterized protein n=1 Tax=Rubrobacter tropicus TaxID=2653851 RepID=A0A6G8Q7W1_9ACTN|nr:hypothetical protein [Rubrobacter tropicus]QIN82522.1 hypothetical protein GBA63_07620 [Rubrobacter tropicus]